MRHEIDSSCLDELLCLLQRERSRSSEDWILGEASEECCCSFLVRPNVASAQVNRHSRHVTAHGDEWEPVFVRCGETLVVSTRTISDHEGRCLGHDASSHQVFEHLLLADPRH